MKSASVSTCASWPSDFGFVADGDAPIVSPRELVKGVLPRNGVTFIGGRSGAGKTFVAIDLAVALATGPEATFFGYPVRERVGLPISPPRAAG